MSEVHYDPNDGGYSLVRERAAVKKGASLLDRILPGWHKKIDLDALQMESGVQCMMGQLFGTDVEGQLARKMYPEEMEEFCSSDGYWNAMGYSYGKPSLIQRLMSKLHLGSKTVQKEFAALRHVCSGHDNKCLWAEVIAERRAADPSKKEAKRAASSKA